MDGYIFDIEGEKERVIKCFEVVVYRRVSEVSINMKIYIYILCYRQMLRLYIFGFFKLRVIYRD